MQPLAKISILIFRRDHQKIAYERRDYESVDEKKKIILPENYKKQKEFRMERVNIMIETNDEISCAEGKLYHYNSSCKGQV